MPSGTILELHVYSQHTVGHHGLVGNVMLHEPDLPWTPAVHCTSCAQDTSMKSIHILIHATCDEQCVYLSIYASHGYVKEAATMAIGGGG